MVQVTKKIGHKKEKTQKSFEFLVLNLLVMAFFF